MPRPFDHTPVMYSELGGDAPAAELDGGAGAARLIAFAMTLLLVSFLVLTRSHDAFDASALTTSRLATGTVELTDDDGGQTLFDLPALGPGNRYSNCINVTYTGTIFDEMVGLRARGGGDLAPHLLLHIELGSGGGFGSCESFSAESTLFEGTLADLHENHGPADRPLNVFTVRRTPDGRTFRITFELADVDDIEDLSASTEFLWSVGS